MGYIDLKSKRCVLLNLTRIDCVITKLSSVSILIFFFENVFMTCARSTKLGCVDCSHGGTRGEVGIECTFGFIGAQRGTGFISSFCKKRYHFPLYKDDAQ